MGWLADGHTEWHHANMDRPWDCPLDCGMAEAQWADDDPEWEDEELPLTTEDEEILLALHA